MNYSTYFLLSLIETNKTRLLVASLLALAMFIPLDMFFRFGFLHYLPKSFIVRGPHDFYANAAHGASEARFLPEAVTPIYVFGGSGMREAMLVGPELGRIVTDNAGHQQQFHSYVLTNIQRSFANDLAALDLIEAKPGIIVYGLSFIRFGMGSKAFDRQLQGHQIIGRNRQFIEYMETNYPKHIALDPLTRLLAADTYLLPAIRLIAERARLLHTSIEFRQHKHNITDLKTKVRDREAQLKNWRKNTLNKHKPKYFEMNLALLSYFIEQANRQGHKVLVVEQPMDYEHLDGRLDKTFEYYRPLLKQRVLELGAKYQDFEKDLDFGTEMFFDLQHLWSPEAREVFTHEIALGVQDINLRN